MLLPDDRQPAAKPPIVVERVPGFPSDLDLLAAAAPCGRGFLRAAWFAAAAHDGETLIARRGCGAPILAIPTASIGSPLVGMRAVPGSYWPFRSVLVSPCATASELACALADRKARDVLMPMWRLGPVYADDPAVPLVRCAAGLAGWTVLARPAGRTWLIDLDGEAGVSRSSRRRLANYEKRLAGIGPVRIDHVSGRGWTRKVLATLGAIEANSWIAKKTDGSGAKFLSAEQRRLWRRMLDDGDLASALSATILFVGDTPAAFSFDLRAGAVQYAIAGSYDDRFAAFRAGRLVTCHQFDRARAEGVTLVDLGVGDSGYKQEMGARPGSAILDLLIVRSRPVASLLRRKWGDESPIAQDGLREAVSDRGRVTPWIAVGAIAAAAIAFAE